MTIRDLKPGESARVISVGGEGALRQHFLDMGVIPEAEVTLVKLAPMGDPMELRIHGYELTLRLADAARIAVEPLQAPSGEKKEPRRPQKMAHPGLGEEGKFHPKGTGEALPEGILRHTSVPYLQGRPHAAARHSGLRIRRLARTP